MMTHEGVRFYVLRNNARYAEIFPKSAPTLRMSSSAEIKESLQGTFLQEAIGTGGEPAEISWLSDEIQAVLAINGNEKPVGLFMPAAVTPRVSNTDERTVEIQAYDRCWRVRDTKVDGKLYYAAGTRYLDIIEGLLTLSGIGMVIKTPTDAVLATDREDWEPGTAYLEIVNELLTEINYKQLWFNASGAAVLEPVGTVTAESVKRIYSDTQPDPRTPVAMKTIPIFPGLRIKTDIYSAPNVFVCICSNPDNDEPMTARAENTNPQSPLSTLRRGRRIMQVETVNSIATQEDLQAYADRLLFDSMTAGETITIETNLLQDAGVNDVVAIQYGDLSGLCIERGWSMQLGPGGKMTHELQRVVLNIG